MSAPTNMEQRNQRELAFRVFNYQTREYDKELYPSATTDDNGFFAFIPDTSLYLIEQYAGHEDPNKVRIFEGDLMRRKADGNEPRDLFVVVMSDGAWEMHSFPTSKEGGVIMPLCPIDKEYEVIGQALTYDPSKSTQS